MDDSKEMVSARQNRTDAHMSSQRLLQNSQDLHRFKSSPDPSIERENWTQDLNPNQEVDYSDTLCRRESQLSPVTSQPVC